MYRHRPSGPWPSSRTCCESVEYAPCWAPLDSGRGLGCHDDSSLDSRKPQSPEPAVRAESTPGPRAELPPHLSAVWAWPKTTQTWTVSPPPPPSPHAVEGRSLKGRDWGTGLLSPGLRVALPGEGEGEDEEEEEQLQRAQQRSSVQLRSKSCCS